ncbi:DUF1858 domain-containing protein [Alkaliphilus crotonatoxidans]
MGILNLRKSIYDLTKEHPDLIEIMVSLGFKDIANPVVRKTAGKIMTLEKGAAMKGIPLKTVLNRLKEEGYEIISDGEDVEV